MSGLNRHRLTAILGLVIAIVASYLALKDVDLQELARAVASAQYVYVLPALVLTFLGYASRTWRWQILIAPLKRIPFTTIFPLLVIGFAWNVAIPLRIGELARAHLLGQRAQLSRSMLLATIVVERVLDGVAIMALLSLVAWLHPQLPEWVNDFSRIATLLFGIAFIALVMLMISEKLTLRILLLATARLPHAIGGRVNALALSFTQGFMALRSPSHVLLIALSTCMIWLIEIASYAVFFPAFGLSLDGPTFFSAANFYAVILNLTTLVPSSPGFVGTMQYFGKLALSVFEVEPAIALSLTVIAHATQLFVILALGLWAIWHEGLSIKRIEQVTVELE